MTVRIPIVTDYNAKGVKQAQKSLGSLDFSIKKLAKTLGVTLSAAAVVQFGKASVKAFLDDDKAAKQLSKTLDNLGIAFESPAVADFISKMEKATGVADDQLRPAFSSLVVALHDAMKAQELLTLAMDVSAGTGKDLGTVTAALQKAYLGNTTALGKLGAGLTKAELASGDFEKTTATLSKLWGGSAEANAKTYAGQLAILGRAADNAKESIGKGLVGALRNVAEGQEITDVADKMQSIADNISYATIGLSEIFRIANSKVDSNSLLSNIKDTLIFSLSTPFRDLTNLGKKASIGLDNLYNMNSSAANASAKDLLELRKKEIAAAEKLAKLRAAEANKAKKAIADQAKLKQASAMFDLDKIQIEAALKGKITEEERIRLELQRAILAENLTQVQKLQDELKVNQAKTAELADLLAHLPKADDPFADWPTIIAKINGLIKDLKLNVTSTDLLASKGIKVDASGTTVVKNPSNPNNPNTGNVDNNAGNNSTLVTTPNGNSVINPNTPQGSNFDYLGFYSGSNLGNPANAGSTFDYLSYYSGNTLGDLGNTANAGSMFDYLNFYGSGTSTAPVTVNITNQGSVIAQEDLTNQIIDQIYVVQSLGTGINYQARLAL